MTEAEWRACNEPFALLDYLKSWSADRKRILFGCACLRASPYRFSPEMQAAIREAEHRADAGPYKPMHITSRSLPEPAELNENAALVSAWLFEVSTAEYAAFHGAMAMTGVGEPDAVPVPECAAQCARLLRCVMPYPRSESAPKPRGWLATAGKGMLNLFAGSPARPIERRKPTSAPPLPVPEADPSWLTSTVLALAGGIYEERAFDRLPILADALMDAGCANDDVLNHCRSDGPHVRGCWVVDLILGKA